MDTAGDSVLAVFPVAADSVMAAVSMHDHLTRENAALTVERQIHARIGINLGDIIDDGHKVFGDEVNVAAWLQEIAPAGGICVSDSARAVIGETLPVEFRPAGEQQLRNIPSAVNAHLVITGNEQPRKASHQHDDPRLSIAVLLFTGLTGDASAESLGEGLTVDLITALSRFRQLFVITQHTSLAQKRETLDRVSLGHRMGAPYLIDGSTRSVGHGFRVAVQLIDTLTDGYLWSENHDGKSSELLTIQDDVTRRIVSTLVSNLEHNAIPATVGPQHSADYTDVIRARQLVYRMREPTDTERARDLFRKVIEVDPGFAPAL